MKKLFSVILISCFCFQFPVIAGTPIGGIIVKGGKNPGGQMIQATTNSDGVVIFQDLKPGDTYTINQQEFKVPENGMLKLIIENQDGITRVIPFKGNRKGWDGVVKGGKTNPKGSEDGSRKTKKETIVPLTKSDNNTLKTEKGIQENGLSN
jgi:hypothetical protein